MEMALRSKNKMSFVNGLVAALNKLDPRYYYWERCNTMLLSWILRALSPTIATCVLWINTAEGVWKDLKKRFSHQGKVTLLMSEKVKTHLENDMLSAFLIGLNDSYTNTRRQIMLMKPLPDVGEAFSMVSQQERQKHDYPPGWKPRNKGMSSVNQVQGPMQESVSSGSLKISSSFTQEDYRRFFEFIQQEKIRANTPLGPNPQVNTIAANFIPNTQFEEVSHIGTVHLSADLTLQNVLCVPLFHYNLISLIGRASESFWHARLGHSSEEKLKALHALDNKICNDKPTACECCHMAKQKRFPFQSSSSVSSHCFDLVHIDIWGPFHVATIYGHKYFLTLVDDHNRATWVYLMRNKSEVKHIMHNFYELINTQFGKNIKCIRDVSFHENIFSFQNSQIKKPSNLILPSEDVSQLRYDEDTIMPANDITADSPGSPEIPSDVPVQDNNLGNIESTTPKPRRSTRTRTKPAYLDDYTCQNVIRRTSPHDM
ncbi:PREDICTED: uncharacterized protein LOC109187024 [Ipomoea nil]|uniref:uncharacterized protein LOC109187024 n=1 Tax=Ipomoea nil TaxID=35883 RepID=UPI0009016FB4|nr:PREDICTED: uncharacterized protein LOC109187024 [Ipomoea nil]